MDCIFFKKNIYAKINELKDANANETEVNAQIKLALIFYYDEQASLHANENDIIILNIE